MSDQPEIGETPFQLIVRNSPCFPDLLRIIRSHLDNHTFAHPNTGWFITHEGVNAIQRELERNAFGLADEFTFLGIASEVRSPKEESPPQPDPVSAPPLVVKRRT